MRIWLIFLVGGLATYLIRASFIVLGSRITLPERVERALRHVGPAVFAAIVAPPVVGTDGLSNRIPEMLAVLAAGVVAWRTGRVTWVLVVGMASLWTLRAVGL